MVKFLGRGEKGATLAELQGSQHFCSNLMGFLRQVNSLSIQREVRMMEPGKPLNGTNVGGSLGSEREPGTCHPTSGWQQAAHTWGKVAGPKNVLGGKLGHEIPALSLTSMGPFYRHASFPSSSYLTNTTCLKKSWNSLPLH